jgi:hypothetical protein
MPNDLQNILGETQNQPNPFEQTFSQARGRVSAPNNLTQYKNNLKEAQENTESPRNISNQLMQFGDNMIKNRQQYGKRDIVDWMGDKATGAVASAKKFWENLRGIRDEGDAAAPPPVAEEADQPLARPELRHLPDNIRDVMDRREDLRQARVNYNARNDEERGERFIGHRQPDEDVAGLNGHNMLDYVRRHDVRELEEEQPHNLEQILRTLDDIITHPEMYNPEEVGNAGNYYNALLPAYHRSVERIREHAPAPQFADEELRGELPPVPPDAPPEPAMPPRPGRAARPVVQREPPPPAPPAPPPPDAADLAPFGNDFWNNARPQQVIGRLMEHGVINRLSDEDVIRANEMLQPFIEAQENPMDNAGNPLPRRRTPDADLARRQAEALANRLNVIVERNARQAAQRHRIARAAAARAARAAARRAAVPRRAFVPEDLPVDRAERDRRIAAARDGAPIRREALFPAAAGRERAVDDIFGRRDLAGFVRPAAPAPAPAPAPAAPAPHPALGLGLAPAPAPADPMVALAGRLAARRGARFVDPAAVGLGGAILPPVGRAHGHGRRRRVRGRLRVPAALAPAPAMGALAARAAARRAARFV